MLYKVNDDNQKLLRSVILQQYIFLFVINVANIIEMQMLYRVFKYIEYKLALQSCILSWFLVYLGLFCVYKCNTWSC